MQQEFVQDDVILNTQFSCGENTLVIRSDLYNPKRTIPVPTHLIWHSEIGIRYCFHRLKLCLLIPYVAFAIYITVVITAGTLVVYLTANQKHRTLFLSYLSK